MMEENFLTTDTAGNVVADLGLVDKAGEGFDHQITSQVVIDMSLIDLIVVEVRDDELHR